MRLPLPAYVGMSAFGAVGLGGQNINMCWSCNPSSHFKSLCLKARMSKGTGEKCNISISSPPVLGLVSGSLKGPAIVLWYQGQVLQMECFFCEGCWC